MVINSKNMGNIASPCSCIKSGYDTNEGNVSFRGEMVESLTDDIYTIREKEKRLNAKNPVDKSVENSNDEEIKSFDEERLAILGHAWTEYKSIMIPELKEYYLKFLSGKTIRRIKIKDISLGKEDIKQLSILMQKISKLKEISLVNNHIGIEDHETINYLCNGLEGLLRLEKLTIENNQIGDWGLAQVCKAANGGSLKHLNLKGNNITKNGLNEVDLGSFWNLIALDIRDNNFDSKCIVKFAKRLQKNQFLEEFYVDTVSPSNLSKIQSYLPNVALFMAE